MLLSSSGDRLESYLLKNGLNFLNLNKSMTQLQSKQRAYIEKSYFSGWRLIRRPSAYLILLGLLTIATGFSQKLALSVKNAPLSQVFRQIEQQTGYTFFYDNQVIRNTPPVTVEYRGEDIRKLLDQVLDGQPLTYRIHKKRVMIKKEKAPGSGSTSVSSFASPEPGYAPASPMPARMADRLQSAEKASPEKKERAVTGKVTDENGEALPGVNILVKGTQQGSVSDARGAYIIEVQNENAVLVFSFVGYISQEIAVGNRTSVDVSLQVDQKALEEVVVVGYGTQKKTSVTAAVSTMKGSEMASTPITNLSNGLGGRMSGLIFKQGSGEPGKDAANIYIRGISTTGSSSPLLIVDDIPRAFQDLDPNTIESVTVLKDAAAVAPYGVAGANGVILVTTKRGKTGAPSLSYNGYVGFQNPTRLTEYPSSYEYAQMVNAAAANEGLPPRYSDDVMQKFLDGSDPDRYPNNNAWDLINRNTALTSHNIEINGGTDRVKYYGSLGYQYEAGLFAATYQNRFNLNLVLDAQVTKTTKVGLSLKGREQNNHYPSETTDRIFITITNAKPDWTQIYQNGLPGALLAGMIHADGYRKTYTTQIFSQLSVEQELPFIKGLKAKGVVAFDPTGVFNKNWLRPVQYWTLDTTTNQYNVNVMERPKAELNQGYIRATQLTFQGSLNYNATFGKSNVGVLALFEAKSNDSTTMGAVRKNYNLSIDELNMGSSSQADINNSGYSTRARQIGFVYRLQYDYDSRYLLEASGRYDGSYYFPRESRFGFFPAVSVGWRLSAENFLKNNVRWLDNLKLRASYGEVGALAGSPFQYLSTYGVYGPAYVLGGAAVQGLRERPEANIKITWERARKTDVGLEFSLWKGLLNMEIDYFFEKRANMLAAPQAVLPSEYGIAVSQENAAEMKNHGIDLMASTQYRVSEDLRLTLSGNFTFAKNTMLKVFEPATTYNNPNRRQTGRALGTQFGYKSLGYFQVDDFDDQGNLKSGIATQPWGKVRPGDIRYQDTNSDQKIDVNDIVVTGKPLIPQIVYGINPGATYKSFALDLLFQGAARSNIYLNNYAVWAFAGGTLPVRQNLDYWTPENPNALNPRITSAPTNNNTQASSHWMRNSSYLRLKSVMLSYSIPSAALEKIRIRSVRIFVSGQNVFTWTPMVNYDPETVVTSGLNYPQQKVISIGTNIMF